MRANPKAALLLLVAALVTTAEAREFRFQKKVMPHVLQNELRAAGFQVTHITCVDDACVVVMPDSEKKDPAPLIGRYVYLDPVKARGEEDARLRELLKKLKDKTITSEEKDRLLVWLVERVLGG